MKELLQKALKNGQKALSEYESKKVVASVGVPITKEELATSKDDAVKIAEGIGYPVAMKGSSHNLTHKTEMGMIRLNLRTKEEVAQAYDEIAGAGVEIEGVLIQEMVKGDREFVIGLSRDPQFGPCVMFGLGGIFTEVIKDVSFRVAPITEIDAEEMLEEIKTKKLLDEFRGQPKADRELLKKALVGIGNLGVEFDEIAEIDINPLIIAGDKPVAVDALVVLKEPAQ